jgi:formylglycine-generating enzyme required for sulfatase activity
VTKYVLALLALFVMSLRIQAVTIDLVTVSDPGNPAEIVSGLGLVGKVNTTYRIAKTEVTNAQYVEFLNAKATTDSLNLFDTSLLFDFDRGIVRTGSPGSYTYAVKETAFGVGPGGSDYAYGDKPVTYVTWYSAIRFANWMSNGQGSGSTETGAYTLMGGTPTPSNASTIVRNAGASWFLPNENEWYKAAYYDGMSGTYYDYPTHTDTVPNNNLPTADTGNSANFLSGVVTTTGDLDYPLTSVGAYPLSESYYQTRDQGGNAAEWDETRDSITGNRVRRGGAWNLDDSHMISTTRDTMAAGSLDKATGFRLAAPAAPAAVPGDYNNNGVVDAADYVVWRKHLGQTFQLENEVTNTSPGTVDEDDYNSWRARFGNTSGSGSAMALQGAAVPEPAEAGMLVALLSAAGWLWGGRLLRVGARSERLG